MCDQGRSAYRQMLVLERDEAHTVKFVLRPWLRARGLREEEKMRLKQCLKDSLKTIEYTRAIIAAYEANHPQATSTWRNEWRNEF
jgi:hypothetical protein